MAEVKLKVEDCKQRDAARGIARIDQKTQGCGIIRIDGFTRKNAGVSINEYVVGKAKVENATSIVLAPIGMHLNVDEDFTNFVKNRLMERTFIKGDRTQVMMLGGLRSRSTADGPMELSRLEVKLGEEQRYIHT